MTLDLDRAELRPPRAEEMPRLCAMLSEVWPAERWLWDAVRAGEAPMYRWRYLCLWLNGEPLGNVSRTDLDIRLGGEVVRVAGVASVATPARYRKRGVARRLMETTLKGIDDDGSPAVLFTDLPAVYEGAGFRVLPQGYRQVRAADVAADARSLRVDMLNTLDAAACARLDRLYAREALRCDGYVARDADYWAFYRVFFNQSGAKRVLICRRGDEDLGYVRVEEEADRLLVSEFCGDPQDEDATQALLGFACKAAVSGGYPVMTLALPPGHYLWRFLCERNVPVEPERGAKREAFMARPAARRACPGLDRLQWSLADKF